MPHVITRLLDLLCLPGKWLSWLILPLILSILAAIVWAARGQNTFLAWEADLPVLGRALTVNGLFDLQWYIFALLVLFGGIWSLREERHVSVDFLWLMMPRRAQLWIRSVGDLVFLLPFCLIITWYGWSFAEVAWTSGEGSTQGGLNSRWLIKAMLPLAFALLGLMALLRGIGTTIELLRPTSKDQT
ncbi:TRAP transporter small permease subunit [Tranquillimonas alkanivorans]|uniref:TRAP transporter small permease protein n=1 Tax=Tranquillimonas alkanivorans TaxID=441119 RepID=A0A1I5UIU3_9RHOB|nr:TRAP transporter small permease subunit [Tranquillimonas alkanivorans]SFP95211.1 TRAP-type mannitol/chloroaromatic compound transport system, small permease component [Tranquillimonas alkanivorans]